MNTHDFGNGPVAANWKEGPKMKTFFADNGKQYYYKSPIPWFIRKFFIRTQPPHTLNTYTVIWHDEGDDYMFTTVETDMPYPSGNDLLTLAAQKEYNSILSPEHAQHLVESFRDANYGLVGVIKGAHKSIASASHLTPL